MAIFYKHSYKERKDPAIRLLTLIKLDYKLAKCDNINDQVSNLDTINDQVSNLDTINDQVTKPYDVNKLDQVIKPYDVNKLDQVTKPYDVNKLDQVVKPYEIKELDHQANNSPHEIKIKLSFIKRIFNTVDSIALRLRFTDVSVYSVTPFQQAKYTADTLLAFYTLDELKTKILTDATSCIGGNTVEFAKLVKHVNAVEIETVHADILKSNLRELNVSNVTVIKNNYLNVVNMLKQDIIFIDPPWGGTTYKHRENIELCLANSNISISKLINEYLCNVCQILIVKLPTNYDFKKIIVNSKFTYNKILTIYATDYSPLYTLLILSHIKPINDVFLKSTKFVRLGYNKVVT